MSENKGFFERAFEDMKEDAAAQHKIDKENLAQVRADSKARFAEATAPNPDVEEFVAAKGFKAKLLNHAERNAKTMRADDRAKYEATLKGMRDDMNELTSGKRTYVSANRCIS